MKTVNKLWLGVGILIFLSPLGLLIPKYFKAGGAWGEWDLGTKLSRLWSAPIPGYVFKGWEGKGPGCLSFAYIISAIAGIAVTTAVVLFIARILVKKGDRP